MLIRNCVAAVVLLTVFVGFQIKAEDASPSTAKPDKDSEASAAAKGKESEQAKDGEKKSTDDKAIKLAVYYFRNNTRCSNCIKFESYTHEAINEFFKDELKNGHIEWRVINIDEKDNRHFVKDYKLDSKAVVLAALQGDKQLRWKNLEKIWDLVGNKDDFKKYIREEVSGYSKKE